MSKTSPNTGLDKFTLAYIEAALWSTNDESTPEGGEPMDNNYGVEDIAPETLEQIKEDCEAFQTAHADRGVADRFAKEAGRDFWLTRNHHGAGFWDGDWPEPDGRVLTNAAHAYGEFYLYVGDDGKIYH